MQPAIPNGLQDRENNTELFRISNSVFQELILQNVADACFFPCTGYIYVFLNFCSWVSITQHIITKYLQHAKHSYGTVHRGEKKTSSVNSSESLGDM